MGYLQIYTGDGKGKTTAAIGLAIRALGAEKRILFLQFMKEQHYCEHNILKNLSPNLTLVTAGKPYFIMKKGAFSEEMAGMYGESCVVFEEGNPPADYKAMVDDALAYAGHALSSGKFDLVVLDELNCALFFHLVKWNEVLPVLEARDENTEVVITGRGAPDELIEMADLVTEFKEVKHYYTQGVLARRGIEM